MPKIIRGKQLERIAYANTPLMQGGEVEYLSLEALQTKLRIRYEEKVEFPTTDIEFSESITGALSPAEIRQQLDGILANPRSDLAVCKINDEVGHGVFALRDIPKDTVLCFYSGSATGRPIRDPNDYAIGYYGSSLSYSTAMHRGISSFFQHLPLRPRIPIAALSELLRMTGQSVSADALKLDDELYAIEFVDKSIEPIIATQNIRKEYIRYQDVPLVIFITDSLIHQGQQLGFKYGFGYHASRGIVPELFDIKGMVIPPNAYRRTFYELNLDGVRYRGELKPLVEQVIAGRQSIIVNGREINLSIVMRELIRVRAMTADEQHQVSRPMPMEQSSADPSAAASRFFDKHPLTDMLKKYKLPDIGPKSLEKGLRNAANLGNLDDLKLFMRYVTNLDAQDENSAQQKTALHWAAIKGHQDCYDLLISKGANPNILDASHVTALQYQERRVKPEAVVAQK